MYARSAAWWIMTNKETAIMIMAAIICMGVSFALLLAMLFLLAKESAVVTSLAAFAIQATWMGLVLYWLTHM